MNDLKIKRKGAGPSHPDRPIPFKAHQLAFEITRIANWSEPI